MSSCHKLSLLLAAGFPLLALTPDTVTVTSSANPSIYGHPVTFTATVSPAGANGKVTFYSGTAILETEPLVAGQASFTAIQLPVGTDAIRVWYSGDATYSPGGSSVLNQAVNPVPQNGFNVLTGSPLVQSPPVIADFNGDGKLDLAVGMPTLSVLLGNGDGTFQNANQVGLTGGSVVSGDFNGDGKADVVLTTGSAVSIFLGNGDGTFQAGAIYLSGTSAYATVVGDFNGDGNADLAVAEPATYAVAILLGNGDGTFQPAVPYSGGPADFLVLGDFNGDGKTDITTDFGPVLLGNGDGTFAPAAVSFPYSGQAPVVAGDLNGDGNSDLVTTNGNYAVVLLANGDGTFQAPVYYGAGGAVNSAIIGDFNGDGTPDLVVAGVGFPPRFPDTLAVLYGRGDGTFETAVPFGNGSGFSLATADLDGNGTADLIVDSFIYLGEAVTTVGLTSSADPSTFSQTVTLTATVSPATATGTVTFYEGNRALANGSLSGGVASASLSTLSLGSHSLTAVYEGDVRDATGTSPILVQTVNPAATPSATTLSSSANPSSFGQSVTLTASVSPASASGTVIFEDGSQTIRTVALLSGTASISISSLSPGSHAITAIFSGNTELAGSTSAVLNQVVTAPGTSSATTLTSSLNPSNLGQSVTLTATVSPVAAAGSVTFYNGTTVLGIATLVAGKASLSTVLLPFGQLALTARYSGGGVYEASYSSPLVQSVKVLPESGFRATVSFNAGSQPYFVASADFNGDGKTDLAVANRSGNNVSILLGKGDGTFQTAVNYAAGTNPECVVTGDFNGDGNSDLAVANFSDNTFGVLLGNSDGTFQNAVNYATGVGPKSLQVADFNGDGNADIAAVNAPDGTISIFAGNGDGTFRSPSTSATNAAPVSLAVGDFNSDGFADLVTANNFSDGTSGVSVSLGKGDGSFSQPVKYGLGGPPTGATSVTVGDFNGDGRPDLAVGTPGYSDYHFGSFGFLILLVGNGDGTFQGGPVIEAEYATFESLAVGDFTGQGAAGLVAAASVGNVALFEPSGDQKSLTPAAVYPAGNGPISLITGDFNGDGTTDVAVANQFSNDVSIILGRAIPAATLVSSLNPANYGQSVTLTATVSPSAATGPVTFFDGAVVLGTAQLSGGTAQITISTLLPGSHSLSAVYSGDANFFGASATLIEQINEAASSATVTFLTSSSAPSNYGQDITLTATVLPATATGAVTFFDGVAIVGTGTLNNGQAKMATSLLDSGKHSLTAHYEGDSQWAPSVSRAFQQAVNPLPQDGFQTPVNTAEGTASAMPYFLATADFNGDGRPDLALMDAHRNHLSILPGNGDGTFGAPVYAASLTAPSSITIGDFNGDGKTDMAVPNSTGPLTVFLGKGNGTFQSALTYPFQTGPLLAADFNHDGKTDLTDGVSILIGNGDGSFQTPVVYNTTAYVGGAAVGDFNRDGEADVAFTAGINVDILLGNGDGTFRSGTVTSVDNSQIGAIAVGDFNGDGKADLAVADLEGGYTWTLLGIGDGTFQNARIFDGGIGSSPIVTGDFNGDGNPDLAFRNGYPDATIGILLGNGDGTFQEHVDIATGNDVSSQNLVVADFNGDSRADIALGTVTVPPAQSRGFVTTLLGKAATQPMLTIRSSPDGLLASVDGEAPRQAPFSVSVPAGPHTIAVSATQSPVSGTQYVFTGWSDAGAASHSITIGTNSVSLLATFKTQYQLTTQSSPASGGQVTPPSGTFVDAGSVVPFGAMASAGYYFTGFSGALSGSVVPQSLTVNGPITVVGNFAAGSAPVVVPHVSGTMGSNGWYRGDVTVTWDVSDSSSGIASSSGCSKTQLTTETAGQTLTCTATNGAGLSTTASVMVRIDKTPPVISGMPAAGCTLQTPDGRLVPVALVSIQDNLSGLTRPQLAVTATSSQLGAKSLTDPDIVIAPDGNGDIVVQLRAELPSSHINGITYTINATATDVAGNRADATATCIEPPGAGQ